jgi:hypothetical protein
LGREAVCYVASMQSKLQRSMNQPIRLVCLVDQAVGAVRNPSCIATRVFVGDV